MASNEQVDTKELDWRVFRTGALVDTNDSLLMVSDPESCNPGFQYYPAASSLGLGQVRSFYNTNNNYFSFHSGMYTNIYTSVQNRLNYNIAKTFHHYATIIILNKIKC